MPTPTNASAASPLPVAEDRALVDALRAAGEAVVFRHDLAVFTSARVSTRVRGGFSDYLSRLDEELNGADDVLAGPEQDGQRLAEAA